MSSQSHPAAPLAQERAKYVEPVTSLHFPASAQVPETQLHLDLRTLLYQLLSNYLGHGYTVGSDQFVYLDASDPGRCVAPDVYIKQAPRGEPIKTWKVWERGAPDVAVEVISDKDSKPGPWGEKFATYQALGVQELVAVDLLTPEPKLRVWNRIDEVLTERLVQGTCAESLVLGLHWVIAPMGSLPRALRVATQLEPLVLVPTELERAQAEAERAKAEAERAKAEAERAKAEAERAKAEAERADQAEARVRQLEAQLRQKDGSR